MKKSYIRECISAVLVGTLIAGILIVSSASPASAVSISYTMDADFSAGESVGVNHDEVHDQLQLNKTSTAFPFIWVPNTDEGTISKIDTRTGNELGRYRTSPSLPGGVTPSPSRTTVDLNGDVWVGNRQAGTVVKVGLNEVGQCQDRNNDGTIETSWDADYDGNITGSEILPWGQDECVLYEVVLLNNSEGTYAPGNYTGAYDTNYWGVAPRGLAIDGNNNLWAGTWSTSKYYYINGTDGQIIKNVSVSPWNHNSYGAVLDRNGTLWSADLGSHVLRINTSNLDDIRRIDIPSTYGINPDFLGHLFVSGSGTLTKVDMSDVPDPILWSKSARTVRGVVVTSDNNVWVAGTDEFGNYNAVSRYDNDGNLLATITGFNQPAGVAVDSAGEIWVGNIGDDYIYRINASTNTIDLSKRILGSGGHYTYSDQTGYVSKTITTTMGTWTVTNYGASNDTEWGRVSLNANIPAGASIDIEVRTANSSSELQLATYVPVSNGIDFSKIGRYIQTKLRFTANPARESPILYDVIIENISATKGIIGTKFNDSNRNQGPNPDPGELGIPGIGIRLTRMYPPPLFTKSFAGFTYTDINGNYSFMNLVPGADYMIEEEISGFNMSQAYPLGEQPNYVLNYKEGNVSIKNFGNWPVQGGEIRGIVFNDSTDNGVQDAGELGIPGVTICLWPSSRCTTTNSSGNYVFSNVALGSQTVYEHVPVDNTSTTPSTVTVTVNSSEVTIVNFGNRVLVPPLPDVTIPGANVIEGVPEIFTTNPLVIRKDLSSIPPPQDVAAVVLTLAWSDGTTKTQSMTENGSTNIWEATFNPPFPAGVARMNFSIDIAGTTNDAFQIGDIIFVDPSGKILDACTGAPISGATATLLVEFPPTTGNFIVSPTGLAPQYQIQIPDINPLITGADGIYSWMTAPGTYKVRAEKSGYLTAESPPVSIPPPKFDLDVRLTPIEKVTIDIKPGTYPNSINLGSSGSVPVAILSSPTFDATTIDPLTVTLASAPVKLKGQGSPIASKQDVNGDGLLDLVVQVSTSALDLSSGDTEAALEGNTYCGKKITGSDTVRIVPP